MPFRQKQPIYGPRGAFETWDKMVVPFDNGECQVKYVSNNQKLPDPKMTDLELQIKAGVNLEKVNTKVLPGNEVAYGMKVVNELIEADTNSAQNSEEVNNEN